MPVESKRVILSIEVLPGLSPLTISGRFAYTSSALKIPLLMGTLISPLAEACLISSTTTTALLSMSGASSCLPAASAPTALTCVPFCIHSCLTMGLREGVKVQTISHGLPLLPNRHGSDGPGMLVLHGLWPSVRYRKY